jgi:hypothetical protein
MRGAERMNDEETIREALTDLGEQVAYAADPALAALDALLSEVTELREQHEKLSQRMELTEHDKDEMENALVGQNARLDELESENDALLSENEMLRRTQGGMEFTAELERQRTQAAAYRAERDALTVERDRLTAVVEAIAEMQPKTLAMLRREGFKFETPLDLSDGWEKLAFTLYSTICEVDWMARSALTAWREDGADAYGQYGQRRLSVIPEEEPNEMNDEERQKIVWEECPLCIRGFVSLEDGDEANCSCMCHHINHDADAGMPGHGWQDCARCALESHAHRSLRRRTPHERDNG